jgi:AraC family transcriptional activator of pobA
LKTIKFDKTVCGVDMLMNVGNLHELPSNYFTDEVHNTDFFEILFFKKAKGYIILNQNKIALNDFSFVFISPFQKRQWQIDNKEIEGQFLIFQDIFLNDFFADKLFTYRLLYFYQLKYPLIIIANSTIYEKVQEVFAEITLELKNTKCDSSHIVRALLYFLLMKLNREYAIFHQLNVSTPLNNYAYQFKKLLEQHIKEKQRIEDYTTLIGVSRITLNKALQTQFNVSASQLIKERLLYEIQNYLIYTKLSINEIANELHFSESNHLMRFFKQQTGLTTTQYRNDYQNGSI